MKSLFICAFLLFATAARAADAPKIILVLTNHAELGETGDKTGVYLSEAAEPYEVFTGDGFEVTIASPAGGEVPIDPKSFKLEEPANAVFWEMFGNGEKTDPVIKKSEKLGSLDPAGFSGIFFAGGHGAMWDMPGSESVASAAAKIYEAGGAVGAVCHGPAALVDVKLSDGSYLVAGKEVAIFTNSEEEKVELTDAVPFLLESKFEEHKAIVKPAPDFTENAVRDGKLVTGQNPQSAKKTAELFVEAVRGK